MLLRALLYLFAFWRRLIALSWSGEYAPWSDHTSVRSAQSCTPFSIEAKVSVYDFSFTGLSDFSTLRISLRRESFITSSSVSSLPSKRSPIATSSASCTGASSDVTCVTLEDIVDLRFTHLQQFSQFFSWWLPFVFLFESHVSFVSLVVGANFVLRAGGLICLLCQRLKDGLANPPNGVRNEFETFVSSKRCAALIRPRLPLVD